MRLCWFDQMSWMQDGDVWIVAVQDLKAVQGRIGMPCWAEPPIED